MVDVIESLTEKLNRIYQLDPFLRHRAKATHPYPPATPAGIRKLGQSLAFAIPPTYREFLKLHDGWEHFWLNFTLCGTGGKPNQRVANEAREAIAWQKKTLAGEGKKTPEEIEEWEREYKRNLFLANHWIIGANFAGDFYVYDLRNKSDQGEMSLCYWNTAYGVSENYGPGFDRFLARIDKKAIEHLKSLEKKQARAKVRDCRK
jgi:cell wall assembly regulator SMI1